MNQSVPVWQHIDIPFVAEPEGGKAMLVDFSAAFTGPDGSALVLPGCWNGGDRWLVRFCPTQEGDWRWRTRCPDVPGLDGRTGTLTAGPPEGESSLYRHGGFLRVSDNKRHLTHTDGTPFFWLGDTLWCCPTDNMPVDPAEGEEESMFRAVVRKRKEQGFSAFQVGFTQGPIREGIPLHDPERWTTGQMAFWQRADRAFIESAAAGIVPVIACGWCTQLHEHPLPSLMLLWRFLVARYASLPVTWMICGEYNMWPTAADVVEKVRALGWYIKELDPYGRAMSVHPWANQCDRREVWDDDWYDFIMLQGGHGQGAGPMFYLEPYLRQYRKPVLEAECDYEGILDRIDDGDVRLAAYRAMQSGSFGFTYGSLGLWNATPGPEWTACSWGKATRWQDALARPGADQMGILRRCYESLDWWKLEPRPQAAFPLGGVHIHTRTDGAGVSLVYFERGISPSLRVLLSVGKPGGTCRAEWLDPRTGTVTAAGEALKIKPGGDIVLPARPDDSDWLLIVRSEQGAGT